MASTLNLFRNGGVGFIGWLGLFATMGLLVCRDHSLGSHHSPKRYIRFHGVRHPQEVGADEVKAFLSHLATQMNVAASTQNQAFSALLFLYQEVLKQRLPWIDDIVRAKRPPRLPVVFTQAESRGVLSGMHGTPCLMAH